MGEKAVAKMIAACPSIAPANCVEVKGAGGNLTLAAAGGGAIERRTSGEWKGRGYYLPQSSYTPGYFWAIVTDSEGSQVLVRSKGQKPTPIPPATPTAASDWIDTDPEED